MNVIKAGLVMIALSIPQIVCAEKIVTPPPVSGRNPGNIQYIIPADVLSRVKLVIAELNLIREALGKPKEQQTIISVVDASPREVYFEAQSLFEKANKLAFEVTHTYEQLPAIHADSLAPAHVWQLVNMALKRIIMIKNDLGIVEIINEVGESSKTTPTDVFNALLQANEELNSLLYSRVSPSDVYEQITLSVNYTANILNNLNISPRIPEQKAYIYKQTPKDVYMRLIKCVNLLESIAEKSGLKMLKVKVDDLKLNQATSSSVFDLSKIIVSEVSYINTLLPKNERMIPFYPGYKTPSDVYQRASILVQQLELLDKAVTKKTDWLNLKKVK
jgi:hypothetical protein